MRECKKCVHWQKDGSDGVCRGGKAPAPRTLPLNEKYVLVWPRTNETDSCGDWEQKEAC